MRIDAFQLQVAGAASSDVSLVTLEGRAITMRAIDIQAIEAQLQVVDSSVYQQVYSKLYLRDHIVRARSDAAAVLALVQAAEPLWAQTIGLVTIPGRAITFRAADIVGVEAGVPAERDAVYRGVRSTVVLNEARITVRSAAADVLALLDGIVPDSGIVDVTVTPYTIGALDHLLLVDDDAVGGPVTINLTPAAGNLSRHLHVKKIGSTAAVTIDPDGAETVDRAATLDIFFQYDAPSLVCDGTEWWLV